MIRVEELKRRSEIGMTCNICGGNNRVKALRFKPCVSNGGITVYLCKSCRAELTAKLKKEYS